MKMRIGPLVCGERRSWVCGAVRGRRGVPLVGRARGRLATTANRIACLEYASSDDVQHSGTYWIGYVMSLSDILGCASAGRTKRSGSVSFR